MDEEFEVFHTYSRKEAIEDGVLVDVTKTAKEAGFVWPVALTRAVWCENVEVPQGVEGQDEAGRLWDILNMLRFAIRQTVSGHDRELVFKLHVRNSNEEGEPPLVKLKANFGYDDDGGPAVTVMNLDES